MNYFYDQVPDRLLLAVPLLGTGEHGLRGLPVQEDNAEQGQLRLAVYFPYKVIYCIKSQLDKHKKPNPFIRVWRQGNSWRGVKRIQREQISNVWHSAGPPTARWLRGREPRQAPEDVLSEVGVHLHAGRGPGQGGQEERQAREEDPGQSGESLLGRVQAPARAGQHHGDGHQENVQT